MSPRTRSRSPRREDEAQWIARKVAVFGRYPHKSPEGLYVDVDGTLNIDNLVAVWGVPHGFTKSDVLKAIRAHMFHDNEESSLRFAIFNDETGQIFVRVTPKGGKVASAPMLTDNLKSFAREHAQRPARRVVQGMYERRKAPPTMKGSVGAAPVADAPALSALTGPTKAQMLGMSLEDIARTERKMQHDALDTQAEAARAGIVPSTRSDQLQIYKPGAAASVSEPDAEPTNAAVEKAKSLKNKGNSKAVGKPLQDSLGVAVRAWVAWILRTGHKHLGVPITPDGWVTVEALFAALVKSPMAQSRRELVMWDLAKLCSTLQERPAFVAKYELNQGRIRKIHRQPLLPKDATVSQQQLTVAQQQRAVQQFDIASNPSSAPSSPRRAMSRNSSRSRSASPAPDNDADMALAAFCQRQLTVVGDAADIDEKEAEALNAERAAAPTGKLVKIKQEDFNQIIDLLDMVPDDDEITPDPPPGEHWTLYQDEGNGDMSWFHYDGPLGQWWCPEGGKPEPYLSA